MFLDTPTGVPNHRRRDVLPLAATTILRRPTGIAVGENPPPFARQPTAAVLCGISWSPHAQIGRSQLKNGLGHGTINWERLNYQRRRFGPFWRLIPAPAPRRVSSG